MPELVHSHSPLRRLTMTVYLLVLFVFPPFPCSAVPNRHFWTEFDGLVLDGLRFLCNRCKKVPRGAKQLGASDESPFAGAAASSTTSAAAASTSAAAAASSYQTIGGSAAAAPREGAYNDL